MSKSRQPSVHPSEWLIPSRDPKGHSGLYQFRAPEDWGRRMEEIIASRAFPFRTPADIHRWCWTEGMKMLAEIEPKCTDLSQITAAERVVRDAEDQQRFLSLFERAQVVIDRAIGEDDKVTARRLVADLRYQFEQMPEGPNQTKYLKALKRWDWLLDKAEAAPLTKLQRPKQKKPRPEAGED